MPRTQEELYKDWFHGRAKVAGYKGGPILVGDRAKGYYEQMPSGDERFRPVVRSKAKNTRGAEVERYKIKREARPILKEIQDTQKKMKAFRVAQDIMNKRMEIMGQQLTTRGQQLLQMLPKEQTKDLEGMDFGEDLSKESLMLRY